MLRRPAKKQLDENLNYSFPTVQERITCFVIDYFFVGFFLLIPLGFLMYQGRLAFVGILFYLLILVYRILCEISTGATWGKAQKNMVVVTMDFKYPSLIHSLKRHIVLILLILLSVIYQLSIFFFFDLAHADKATLTYIRIGNMIFGKLSLYVFLFIDLWSIHRDPMNMNRSIHDRMAGTVVIKVN
jgi:hypothetical protein